MQKNKIVALALPIALLLSCRQQVAMDMINKIPGVKFVAGVGAGFYTGTQIERAKNAQVLAALKAELKERASLLAKATLASNDFKSLERTHLHVVQGKKALEVDWQNAEQRAKHVTKLYTDLIVRYKDSDTAIRELGARNEQLAIENFDLRAARAPRKNRCNNICSRLFGKVAEKDE